MRKEVSMTGKGLLLVFFVFFSLFSLFGCDGNTTNAPDADSGSQADSDHDSGDPDGDTDTNRDADPDEDHGNDADVQPDSEAAPDSDPELEVDADDPETCSLDAQCSDGNFCRIATGECLPLVHESCATSPGPECYGFRAFEEGPVTTVSTCTQAALQEAIDEASSDGGGTVRIDPDACPNIDVHRLTIKSNVILDGMGATLTTVSGGPVPEIGILFDNWTTSSAENMVVRNLVLEGSTADDIGITTAGRQLATNVLIEGLEVIGFYRNSIDIHNCIRCTVRYNNIHGDLSRGANFETGHGVTVGVSYFNDLTSGGPFYSQIHSNHLWDHTREGFYAFDIHRRSDSYEIAGNHAHDLNLGVKFIVGARNLMVHHNDFENMDRCGFVTYSHNDEDRIVNNRFHYNSIRNAGAGAICFSWGTEGIWQADELELWYNELVDSESESGCTTLLKARMTNVSVRGSHGNICTIGSPVEWTCDEDPPCDTIL